MKKSQIEALVEQKYDRLSSIYDNRWQDYIHNSLSLATAFADISASTKILDVACGTGELIRLLLEQNPRQQITGVDISQAMLAVAKDKLKTHPQVTLHCASVSSLPHKVHTFDLVICANAFHYFVSPQAALAEMKRVLKPRGEIIILDWCRDYLALKVYNFLSKFIDSGYQKCYTQKELEQHLKIADFQITQDEKVNFGIIWELMAIKAKSLP